MKGSCVDEGVISKTNSNDKSFTKANIKNKTFNRDDLKFDVLYL